MSSSLRPPRADAARNRELLLAAAEDEFAEHGAAASVADIARRAGVAKGTVFRHFATKEDLIASIVIGHLATLAAVARDLADSSDPGAALLEFLIVAADQCQQHDLTFLRSVTAEDSRIAAVGDEVYAGVELLVDRARDAGAIRPDVTGADVYLLSCAPVRVAGNATDPSPDLWRRYLTIIFDGLRPDGASPLSQPAPTLP
jgi:AcrR family transcriptional regulator